MKKIEARNIHKSFQELILMSKKAKSLPSSAPAAAVKVLCCAV